MAPPRSVFLVTRRDFTSDSEGRLEVLEAFATRDAATEAAEAHGEEEDAEVKFEVTELSVKEGWPRVARGRFRTPVILSSSLI